MKRVNILVYAIAILYFAAEARSEEPAWYRACEQFQGNAAAMDLCFYSQSTFVHNCVKEPLPLDEDGNIVGDLSAPYLCLNAYYYPDTVEARTDDLVAPDGALWRDHYINNDINRVKAEACVACLKVARNRKKCGC